MELKPLNDGAIIVRIESKDEDDEEEKEDEEEDKNKEEGEKEEKDDGPAALESLKALERLKGVNIIVVKRTLSSGKSDVCSGTLV